MASRAVKSARRGVLFSTVLASGIASFAVPSPIPAQTVEEHPAPLAFGPQVETLSASALASSPNDPTPFGITLAGIAVVDAHTHGNAARAHSAQGVDTSLAGPTAQAAGFRAVLAKYVGQPLSYQLISQIQADITKFYRDNGRSLVNVTVPPQEITGGVLQVNVNTFVLETTRVEGAPAVAEGFVNRQVRLRPGQEVDTNRLLEDVNWLNQNPFRHVSVVFEPGATPDSTQLILQVTHGRPWSGYVGASNSGSKDTGVMRVFGGVNMSALPWQDHQLSYQFTGAPESLGRFNLWNTGDNKGYVSHALTYFVPITFQNGFRTKVTFGANHISSYSVPGGFFTAGNETTVANVELSFPLPKTSGRFALVPEVYLQAEYNDYDRTQFLLGFPVDEENTKLVHGVVGVRAGMTGEVFGKKSRGSADIGLVFGRQETAGDPEETYSLIKFSVSQEVFIDKDRSVELRLNGQYSDADGRNGRPLLHALEQMALGGDGTVRGYPVNGVSGQSAIATSIQYNFAPMSFRVGSRDATFRPNVFADMGHTLPGETALGVAVPGEHMAAIGLGGEIGIGEDVVGSVHVASPLIDAGATEQGDVSFAFQVTARF